MHHLLLFQTDAISFPWQQYVNAGGTVMLVMVTLYCLLKALPTWKGVKDGDNEVKKAEILVREKEAEARTAQAASFGQLSSALTAMADVVSSVSVDNKHSISKVSILQRVNADTGERTESKMDELLTIAGEVVGKLESVETQLSKHDQRLAALEKGVQKKDGSHTQKA